MTAVSPLAVVGGEQRLRGMGNKRCRDFCRLFGKIVERKQRFFRAAALEGKQYTRSRVRISKAPLERAGDVLRRAISDL